MGAPKCLSLSLSLPLSFSPSACFLLLKRHACGTSGRTRTWPWRPTPVTFPFQLSECPQLVFSNEDNFLKLSGWMASYAYASHPLPFLPLFFPHIHTRRASELQAISLPRRICLALQQISAASLPARAERRFMCADSRF